MGGADCEFAADAVKDACVGAGAPEIDRGAATGGATFARGLQLNEECRAVGGVQFCGANEYQRLFASFARFGEVLAGERAGGLVELAAGLCSQGDGGAGGDTWPCSRRRGRRGGAPMGWCGRGSGEEQAHQRDSDTYVDHAVSVPYAALPRQAELLAARYRMRHGPACASWPLGGSQLDPSMWLGCSIKLALGGAFNVVVSVTQLALRHQAWPLAAGERLG